MATPQQPNQPQQPQPQPPQQPPQPPQGQGQTFQCPPELQAQAQAVGLDFSQIDWRKLMQIVMVILQALQQQPTFAAAGGADAAGHGHHDAMKDAACKCLEAAHCCLGCCCE